MQPLLPRTISTFPPPVEEHIRNIVLILFSRQARIVGTPETALMLRKWHVQAITETRIDGNRPCWLVLGSGHRHGKDHALSHSGRYFFTRFDRTKCPDGDACRGTGLSARRAGLFAGVWPKFLHGMPLRLDRPMQHVGKRPCSAVHRQSVFHRPASTAEAGAKDAAGVLSPVPPRGGA